MKHVENFLSSHIHGPTGTATSTHAGMTTRTIRRSDQEQSHQQDDELLLQDRFEQVNVSALTHHAVFALGFMKHDPSLTELIKEITKPGFFIQDIEKTEAALTKHIRRKPDETDAYLWRGIVRRIRGEDGRQDLRHVLMTRPQDRLAILNLAAMPLCASSVSLEENAYESSELLIADFLKNSPHDPFAKLIGISLKYCQNDRFIDFIASLEKLHFKHPDYAPAIAIYAALLNERHRISAAVGFASKALKKDKYNALAHNLTMMHESKDKGDKILSPIYGLSRMAFFSWKMPFYAPYAQQDVLYAA